MVYANINNDNEDEWANVFAIEGFCIAGPDCRADNFPGTICYYFEAKINTSVW
jgi:hypothetical protein